MYNIESVGSEKMKSEKFNRFVKDIEELENYEDVQIASMNLCIKARACFINYED